MLLERFLKRGFVCLAFTAPKFTPSPAVRLHNKVLESSKLLLVLSVLSANSYTQIFFDVLFLIGDLNLNFSNFPLISSRPRGEQSVDLDSTLKFNSDTYIGELTLFKFSISLTLIFFGVAHDFDLFGRLFFAAGSTAAVEVSALLRLVFPAGVSSIPIGFPSNLLQLPTQFNITSHGCIS